MEKAADEQIPETVGYDAESAARRIKDVYVCLARYNSSWAVHVNLHDHTAVAPAIVNAKYGERSESVGLQLVERDADWIFHVFANGSGRGAGQDAGTRDGAEDPLLVTWGGWLELIRDAAGVASRRRSRLAWVERDAAGGFARLAIVRHGCTDYWSARSLLAVECWSERVRAAATIVAVTGIRADHRSFVPTATVAHYGA